MQALSDCERCMQTYDRPTRQALGCGYEPPAPRGVPVMPWDHDDRRGPPLTVCVGYTTNLPEVIEVSHARLHWSKSQLDAYLGDERPTEQLLGAIVILEAETNTYTNWRTTPKRDGGGGV